VDVHDNCSHSISCPSPPFVWFLTSLPSLNLHRAAPTTLPFGPLFNLIIDNQRTRLCLYLKSLFFGNRAAHPPAKLPVILPSLSCVIFFFPVSICVEIRRSGKIHSLFPDDNLTHSFSAWHLLICAVRFSGPPLFSPLGCYARSAKDSAMVWFLLRVQRPPFKSGKQ